VQILIVIVSPVTRREYIPIGSTAASMPPTVTVATMPILTTIELFIWLKAFCPKVESVKKSV